MSTALTLNFRNVLRRAPEAQAKATLPARTTETSAPPAVWPPAAVDYGACRAEAHRLRAGALTAALISAGRRLGGRTG